MYTNEKNGKSMEKKEPMSPWITKGLLKIINKNIV